MSKAAHIVLRTNVVKHNSGHFHSESNSTTVFSGMALGQTINPETLEYSLAYESLSSADLADIKADKYVAIIAPVMPLQLHKPVNYREVNISSNHAHSWGIGCVRATHSPYTGDGVTVATLDTGIDIKHPVFSGVPIVEKDFTNEGNGDHNGHGTHTAGVVFGQNTDNYRIGIAQNISKALVGKVIDAHGRGCSRDIVRGIEWAYLSGANVILMSLGLDFPGYVKNLMEHEDLPMDIATSRSLGGFYDNIELFRGVGEILRLKSEANNSVCMLISGAGNDSRTEENKKYKVSVTPPAVINNMISVGALKQDKYGLASAGFSNTDVDLAAPGVNIVSAKRGGGFITMDGTSIAASHVAGIATLYAEKRLKSTACDKHTTTLTDLVQGTQLRGINIDTEARDIGRGLVQAPL